MTQFSEVIRCILIKYRRRARRSWEIVAPFQAGLFESLAAARNYSFSYFLSDGHARLHGGA